MVDMVKEQRAGTSAPSQTSTLRNVSEQAASTAQTVKEGVSQASAEAARTFNEKREEFADRAQDFAADIKDRVEDKIDEQKDAGAEYASRVAAAMRRAAREFEPDVPIAARYMRFAADNVADYAEKFRTGELNDFIEGAKTFARQQPTAFLGLTFLAGFGLVRLLKTSSVDDRNSDRQG